MNIVAAAWMIVLYAGTAADHIAFSSIEACEKAKVQIEKSIKERNSWNTVPTMICVEG